MCDKPGKGRHGTSRHAKAIHFCISNIKSFLPVEAEISVTKEQISQLLLKKIILYLIYGFDMVTCTVSPLSRFTAHLLPVYHAT
jgi:hypothetical protein